MDTSSILTVTDDSGNAYVVYRSELEPVKLAIIGEKNIEVVRAGSIALLLTEELACEFSTIKDVCREYDGVSCHAIVDDFNCYAIPMTLEEAEAVRDDINEVIKELRGL